MLNRETLATKETDNCRSHKLKSRHHYRHHHHHKQQQLTKLCSPSLLTTTTTGSERKNSINSFIYNTDAILSKARNNQLVSQPQKSSITTPTSFSLSTSITDSTTSLKLANNRTRQQKLANPTNLTTKQQPVNPRDCWSKRDYLRADTYITMIKMNPIYYLTGLLLALCALSTTAQFVTADGSLHSNLQKLKISPDIINVPNDVNIIKVELYGNVVKPGDPVPAKNFKDLNMAKIHWDVSNFDARHTLLLLDLDRKHPGNGTNSIYNQFTSLNIPGNIINAGQTIVAFDTPIVPCQPSSKHRILMLAFHQKQSIDITDVAYMSAPSGLSTKRENFKLNEFINRHRLDLVAANVFLAIGETNGVCSASITLHSLQSVSPSILIAMVTAITVLGLTSSKRSLVN